MKRFMYVTLSCVFILLVYIILLRHDDVLAILLCSFYNYKSFLPRHADILAVFLYPFYDYKSFLHCHADALAVF